MPAYRTTRRGFLAGLGAAACAAHVLAGDRPPVTRPRATDGDERFEPDWDERLTVTVGVTKGDLVGADDKVLQAALDYVARFGGGTVKVLPGTYRLRNAVFLPSRVRLLGSGADSVITKIPSESVELADDSDWYDREITLKDAAGFRVGDGVVLRATNPHDGGETIIKRTLVARSGRRFKLDRGLRENLWLSGKPT
ncbi:MAG TPA: twin-arginine translocation signal domain-containing protein, partial [Gemmataceae bacterium]